MPSELQFPSSRLASPRQKSLAYLLGQAHLPATVALSGIALRPASHAEATFAALEPAPATMPCGIPSQEGSL